MNNEILIGDDIIFLDGIILKNKNAITLNNISFNIKKGDIFGIYGTKNSGKTALLRVICGIIKPDFGTVTYDNENDNVKIRENISYVPQNINAFDDYTCEELILLFAKPLNISSNIFATRKAELFELFNLANEEKTLVKNLSFTNQKKLMFICALIKNSPYVILDDPFYGVDIVNIFNTVIQDLQSKAHTIIIASNFLEHLSNCDKIAVLDNGTLLDILDVKASNNYTGDVSNILEKAYLPTVKSSYKKSNFK